MSNTYDWRQDPESGVQPMSEAEARALQALTNRSREGRIYAFITCTRVKWEATVAEMADMEGTTEAAVREEWADDTDYDSASDTIRLEDPIEEHGWVDRGWGSRVLHDSRNDVAPAVDFDLSDLASDDPDVREEAEGEVQNALNWLEGGFEDNGDGTFCATGTYQPYDEPWHYDYALHFTRKFLGTNGYAEEAWHPVKDGGITL